MNVVIRQPGAEERPVLELAYGAHDIPAGAHRIKTPDGQLRDIDAEARLTITILRPAIFPEEGPSVSVSLRSRGRDCCNGFFLRRSHDIDCPDGRPVPDSLAPFMHSDPAVAAFVYAYQRGNMDEASMWRGLARHQTQAAEDARKMAFDAVSRCGVPMVLSVDKGQWEGFQKTCVQDQRAGRTAAAPECDCDVSSGGGTRHKPGCPAHPQNCGSP